MTTEAAETTDFRGKKMPSREGLGLAWGRYTDAVNRLSQAGLLPGVTEASEKLAREAVLARAGFWLVWQLEGGFDGMRRLGMSEATISQVADLVKGGRHVNLTVSGRSARGLSGQERAALERDRIRTVVAELLRHGISKAQASLLWQSSPNQAQLNQATMGDSGAGLREIARIRVG